MDALPEIFGQMMHDWINTRVLIVQSGGGHFARRSPIVPGEYNISVRREVKLSMPGDTQPVIVQKTFRTSALSTDPPNIAADVERFRIFLNTVDQEFVSKVIDTESEMIERHNPSGWIP